MILLRHIAKYFMVLCMVNTVVLTQAGSPEHASPPDSTLAKNEVISFCSFWKIPKLDSMRAVLGKNTRADSLFMQTYFNAGKGPGKVVKYLIVGAAQDEKGMKIIVKLTFKKQAPPHSVDGVHNFFVEKENGPVLRSPGVFRDGGGKWRIKMVVAPIAPPVGETGGSRPGE